MGGSPGLPSPPAPALGTAGRVQPLLSPAPSSGVQSPSPSPTPPEHWVCWGPCSAHLGPRLQVPTGGWPEWGPHFSLIVRTETPLPHATTVWIPRTPPPLPSPRLHLHDPALSTAGCSGALGLAPERPTSSSTGSTNGLRLRPHSLLRPPNGIPGAWAIPVPVLKDPPILTRPDLTPTPRPRGSRYWTVDRESLPF